MAKSTTLQMQLIRSTENEKLLEANFHNAKPPNSKRSLVSVTPFKENTRSNLDISPN